MYPCICLFRRWHLRFTLQVVQVGMMQVFKAPQSGAASLYTASLRVNPRLLAWDIHTHTHIALFSKVTDLKPILSHSHYNTPTVIVKKFIQVVFVIFSQIVVLILGVSFIIISVAVKIDTTGSLVTTWIFTPGFVLGPQVGSTNKNYSSEMIIVIIIINVQGLVEGWS